MSNLSAKNPPIFLLGSFIIISTKTVTEEHWMFCLFLQTREKGTSCSILKKNDWLQDWPSCSVTPQLGQSQWRLKTSRHAFAFVQSALAEPLSMAASILDGNFALDQGTMCSFHRYLCRQMNETNLVSL